PPPPARRTDSGARPGEGGRPVGPGGPRSCRCRRALRWRRAPARAPRASPSRSRPGGLDVGWLVLVAVLDEDPVRVERGAAAPPPLADNGRALLEQAGRVPGLDDRNGRLAVGDLELHALRGLGDRAGDHGAGDAQAIALLPLAVLP